MTDLGVAGQLFDHTAVLRAGSGGWMSAAVARSHRSLKELEQLCGQHQGSRKLGRSTT
ncbi:hypothetical protein Taro_052103 [Colocasia esculenta]|uniref:Uncharacterized protein n=1 Tax=Colocasia esculenta TaxID=4460 RepID=A0A843XIN4_COLES|nr:hypothetical protein [Colocasia esculenta]